MTQVLHPTPEGLSQAAALLRDGGLVAFPSETVYGLGGDATNDHACAAIFAAKGRPTFNPLIVHLPDLAAVERYAVVSDAARRLAQAFWPGPLTLVLPVRQGLSPLVTAGLKTVAIRVPAHPVAQALLRACDVPLAGPSANVSGTVSPTTAAHVLKTLEGRIGAVLDGGACAVGVESTILRPDPPTVLRDGGLSVEAIEAVTGPLTFDTTPGKVAAPGQLSSHYAPQTPVRMDVVAPDPQAVLIGFGAVQGELNLSATGDLIEAAANLFAMLHAADAMARARIDVAPIPEIGLGRAINDRLRRASAPR